MAASKRAPSLSALEAQKAELNDKIRKLKRQQKRDERATEKERFATLGNALARELEENHDLADQLEPLINARVTKASERRLLGLPSLTRRTDKVGK